MIRIERINDRKEEYLWHRRRFRSRESSSTSSHFPDRKRYDLLSKHLEPDTVKWLSSTVLNDQFTKLKTGPEHELRAFIRQKFGDTEEHLRKTVKHGESLCEGLWEDIYRGG